MDLTYDKSLFAVSEAIEYDYASLWGVYKSKRNLPIIPLRNLCRMVGMKDEDAFAIYEAQPKPKTKAAKD